MRRTLAASQLPEEDTDAPVGDAPAVRRVLLASPLGSPFPALLQ